MRRCALSPVAFAATVTIAAVLPAAALVAFCTATAGDVLKAVQVCSVTSRV